MEIGIIGIFTENLYFYDFEVPGVPEGLRRVSGGGMLHPDRIWAPTEPSRPNSSRIL